MKVDAYNVTLKLIFLKMALALYNVYHLILEILWINNALYNVNQIILQILKIDYVFYATQAVEHVMEAHHQTVYRVHPLTLFIKINVSVNALHKPI